jgi:hypothetical protein
MRPVSITTFIEIIYCDDDNPPSESTIRRRLEELPGAFRDGRRWRIDLDYFLEVMDKRIRGLPETMHDASFVQSLANQLR